MSFSPPVETAMIGINFFELLILLVVITVVAAVLAVLFFGSRERPPRD